METKNLTDAMNWRYATKAFDSSKKIPEKDFENLLEVLRLAPSSFGLQPWKFVVVANKELRQKIRKASWDQPQVTDASHLIIFTALNELNEKYLDKFIELIAKTRNQETKDLESYKDMISNSIKNMTKEQLNSWNEKQVYIALGNLLTAAATAKIDACPMEGFDRKQVDDILNLKAQGVHSVVMCAIGFRSQDDKSASLKKVRFEKKDVVIVTI